MKIDISTEKKELIKAAGKLNAACIELLAQLTAMPDEGDFTLTSWELEEATHHTEDPDYMDHVGEKDPLIKITTMLHRFQKEYAHFADRGREVCVPLMNRTAVLLGGEEDSHAED